MTDYNGFKRLLKMTTSQINYTVIIPHYNIPELLGRCLRTIPQRPDIQVIVVDDCSPEADRYFDAVPELSRANVEFYTTPEGGSAGRARNVGIEHAQGRWVTFVDADDMLTDDAFDILDGCLDRPEDVLYFPSRAVMSDDLTQPSARNMFVYNFEHYFSTKNEQTLRYEFDAPWGKFIKKSLIDKFNIRFAEIKYSNDTYFSASIGIHAERIFVGQTPIYIVTERSGSLTADKMNDISEWRIRFHSALQVQSLFDSNKINYKRYAFCDYLKLMWHRNRSEFFRAYGELSLRNKWRYLYCLARGLK